MVSIHKMVVATRTDLFARNDIPNYLAKQIFKRNCYTIIIENHIFRFAVSAQTRGGWPQIGIIRFNQTAAVLALKLCVFLEEAPTANAKRI